MCQSLLLFALLSFTSLYSPPHRKALYGRLDQQSLNKQLAFYRLFPDSIEGQKALARATVLLPLQGISFSPSLVEHLIKSISPNPNTSAKTLSQKDLEAIENLSSGLENRKLKGYTIWDEEEILKLPKQEIDLGRALLLAQLPPSIERKVEIRTQEALFDTMALHIKGTVKPDASPHEMVQAISSFVFDQMGFRFPPHSQFMGKVDKYTSLPSVIDQRKGVCLGVSILYLCLAQRLGLPLEIITPPGHIFVRYEGEEGNLNIETTLRGVCLPDEAYLNLETRDLEKRSILEVVGLSHINEASTHLLKKDFEKSLSLYQKALKYLVNDPLLKELIGYNLLFLDREAEGKEFLQQSDLKHHSLARDYLEGRCDAEALKTVFLQQGSGKKSRALLEETKKNLQKILTKWPSFRSGWLYLAMSWLEAGREGEALSALEGYHDLDQTNPTVEYFLSALYLERGRPEKGWCHYLGLTKLLEGEESEQVKALKRNLLERFPLPGNSV